MRYPLLVMLTAMICLGAVVRAEAPEGNSEPMQLSLVFYNEKMRQSGQPPAMKYGEGSLLVEMKWKPAFKEADDVYYIAWIRGESDDWASANAPKGKDELGVSAYRQYAYLGKLRTGASTGTRVKMGFGYRPAGLSSYPIPGQGNNGLLALPEATPLAVGTHRFVACVQRVGPAGATEHATVPFAVTIGGDASAGAVQGISSQQVFQRSSANAGDVVFRLVGASGAWKATLARAGQAMHSVSGTASTAPVEVRLAGVPVGGPYSVELTAGGKLRAFSGIYIGDLWIISGQSNAVGCGNDATLGAKPMPGVQCLDPKYGLLEWTPARDGLFQQTVGPWVTAAQTFYQETRVPVGLLGHATGSKAMDYFLDGERMDPYFLRPLVEQHGVGAAAFFWYQGESDSFSPALERAYPGKLKALADSMRSLTRNPKLMIGVCQLGRYLWQKDHHFAAVREAQRRFALNDSRAALYSTLPYEINAKDKIHLETASYIALGRQIARQMIELERTGKTVTPGPTVQSVRFAGAEKKQLAVTFTRAEGLTGQPSTDEWYVMDDAHRGFKDGGFAEIESITIQPARQQVLIQLKTAPTGNVTVSYGYRADIGGSLTNGDGFPAACFVAVPVE